MTESNVFNMTVKREGGGLTAQSADGRTTPVLRGRGQTISSSPPLTNSHPPDLFCFHEFASNAPRLLTDLISSVSQPLLPAAGRGGVSLSWRHWETHTHTHTHTLTLTHTHITILERTQYGFPLIPWKITKSPDPNICSGGNLTMKSASPSACEPKCLRENQRAVEECALLLPIIHCAAEPGATPSQWWDLTRLTSRLSVHTPRNLWAFLAARKCAHSLSQEQDATLKSFHSFRWKNFFSEKSEAAKKSWIVVSDSFTAGVSRREGGGQ